jgi:ribosomal protein S18 acetylase RimI-like enzyme
MAGASLCPAELVVDCRLGFTQTTDFVAFAGSFFARRAKKEPAKEGKENAMIRLHALRWPDDRDAIRSLDISFTTDRIYGVRSTGLSFTLVETPVAPALHKDYGYAELDELPAHDYVAVAEVDDIVVGVATLELETWNRRAILRHLLIDAAYRGQGLGRALIADVLREARERGARCLWLETQNINYPAIQFYQRLGFQCCGLDTTLYDPQAVPAGEIALFFALQLT